MKSEKESDMQFFGEMSEYLELIKSDYARFQTPVSNFRQEMIDKFNANIRYEVGSKYIKVITEDSVHSFIVRNKTDKFKPGDILMAASWKAPARNFARGNIFDKTFDRIRWTGAM